MCLLLNQITLHYPHLISMPLEVISLELQSAEQAECSGITRKRRSGAEGKDLEWMTHSKN
jgi:hypothetical protein